MMPVIAFKDQKRCVYCGCEFGRGKRKPREHITPRLFRINAPSGVAAACEPCNIVRAAMTPTELRDRAASLRTHAQLLDTIADRVDDIVDDRSLPAPWLGPAQSEPKPPTDENGDCAEAQIALHFSGFSVTNA